jgi:hypothetical protein
MVVCGMQPYANVANAYTSGTWKQWVEGSQTIAGFVVAASFIGLSFTPDDIPDKAELIRWQNVFGSLAFALSALALLAASSASRQVAQIALNTNSAGVPANPEGVAVSRRWTRATVFIADITACFSVVALSIAVVLLAFIQNGSRAHSWFILVVFSVLLVLGAVLHVAPHGPCCSPGIHIEN